jgi:hypothetical protein
MICYHCTNVYLDGNRVTVCKIDGHVIPDKVFLSKLKWEECPLEKVGWYDKPNEKTETT